MSQAGLLLDYRYSFLDSFIHFELLLTISIILLLIIVVRLIDLFE